MFVYLIGGVYHLFTSRGLGMAVQPSRSEIKTDGKPPATDAEAVKLAASGSARGLDWHPCRITVGPVTLVGYFGEAGSVPAIGEVVKGSSFSV